MRRDHPDTLVFETVCILAPVLVDVHHDVAGSEAHDAIQPGRLGPSHPRHAAHVGLGVDAEAGPSHHLCAQAKVEQQLGDAGHQADDARSPGRWRVSPAQGIRLRHDHLPV